MKASKTSVSESFTRTPCHKTFEYEPLARTTFQAYEKRNLTCISRLRHARSPQRVARDQSKTQSHLDFAPSTRTISAEVCARPSKNTISPAFRAFDAHDLRRGLHATGQRCNLTYISHLRRTISAEGCTRPDKNAFSPAFRAFNTHDLRRGLTFVMLRRHRPRFKRERKEEREDLQM